MSNATEGWGFISQSTKWHYYTADGRSLCRKFMKLSLRNLEQGNDSSHDNCAKCKQALAVRKGRVAE